MRPFESDGWAFGPTSRLVVLTGAGVSADSGVKTFRDAGGLWENHRIEDVATPAAWQRNPGLVRRFYDLRRAQLFEVSPNPAHLALAALERRLGERFLLVTQNVDDLHARAGSRRLLAMHGQLRRLRCEGHPSHGFVHEGDQEKAPLCPRCGATVRPDIVWFGEMPYHLEEIDAAVRACTHFAYVGTSSQVYPAAGYRRLAKAAGAKVLCINLEVEPDSGTDFWISGRACEAVPRWVETTEWESSS